MYFVSIVIGLILVISSLFLIRSEFNKAINTQARLLEQSKLYNDADLFKLLEDMQSSIDNMNQAFYEIASDLEGKYSIHEKELMELQGAFQTLKTNGNFLKEVESIQKSTAIKPDHQNQSPIVSTSEKDTLKYAVQDLKNKGMSASQIAKELNVGIGEVQLFLRIKQ